MKFRTLILGVVLTALWIGEVSAQGVQWGLEGGANVSNMSFTSGASSDLTSRLGFVGGVFFSFSLGNSFAIRPELLFEQKGFDASASGSFSGSSWEYDYIEMPILAKLSLGTPAVNPSLLLGPAFSLNTSFQYSYQGISQSYGGTTPMDVGIVAGVELDLNKFQVSARYELGLVGISASNTVQNRTFTFLLGYSFI